MATLSRPNVIVIVIDTLRKDSAASLVNSLEGWVDYGRAITPAPWTIPAHVSLLTGLYPSIHESHETEDMKSAIDFAGLRNDKTTLMTRLKKMGYSTYGYSANNFISTAFGFDGFDVLKNWEVSWHKVLFKMDKQSIEKLNKFVETRRARDFVTLIARVGRKQPGLLLSWMASEFRLAIDRIIHKWPRYKGLGSAFSFVKQTTFKEPFFLFLNILEVHEPYFKDDHLTDGIGVRRTSTIPKIDLDRWVDGYQSQVKLLAAKLPNLFKSLAKKGLLDNSLVILTSDHGQLLGEHGWIGHGVFLYDELVQVPLLVKYPLGAKVSQSSRSGEISLTSIQKFIIDIVEGRETDSSLYSPQVFSESWANYNRKLDGRAENGMETDLVGRRICVYADEGKVTYKLDTKEVEESSVKGDSRLNTECLVEKCVKFAGLNQNLLEVSAKKERTRS